MTFEEQPKAVGGQTLSTSAASRIFLSIDIDASFRRVPSTSGGCSLSYLPHRKLSPPHRGPSHRFEHVIRNDTHHIEPPRQIILASTRHNQETSSPFRPHSHYSLETMKCAEDTSTMTVGELRQWLAQFGEKNQDHYSKGHLQIDTPTYSIRERILQVEESVGTKASAIILTPSTTTKRDPVPPKETPSKGSYHDDVMSYCHEEKARLESRVLHQCDSASHQDVASSSYYEYGYHDTTRLEPKVLPYETFVPSDEDDSYGYDDHVVKPENVPVFRTFEKEEATAPTVNGPRKTTVSKELENYRIVSIQKLLEVPVARPHRQSFSSWDDFDDFSDPWTNPSLWHPIARQRSLLDGDISDHKDQEEEQDAISVAATDPGMHSLSRQLARRLTKSSKTRDNTIKQKSVGMFRRKLPMLLCKSAKDNQDDAADILSAKKPPTLFEIALASSGEPMSVQKKQEIMEAVQRRNRSPPATQMHSASIFQGKTLTSNTLDLLCGNKTEPPRYHRTSMSEEGTVSTWSEDSGQPSIAPGALDSRLGEVFAEEAELDNHQILSEQAKRRQEAFCVLELNRSSDIDPLSFQPRQEEPSGEHKSIQPSRSLKNWQVTPAARVHNYSPTDVSVLPSQPTSITSAVRRFGGGARNSAIERRKEELERKWAAERAPFHVKKVKWQVCQRTGTYKRQIILDFAGDGM